MPPEPSNVVPFPGHDATPPAGDLIFPSSNDLEVPDLVMVEQDSVDAPLSAWGSFSRRGRFRGTWHFYVDDYRFTHVWEKPEAVVATGALGACEVNYSVFEQTPFPVALFATYRKRWLSRFWQSRGLDVWVDLNVAESYAELNLLGVPVGWRWYSTRGYDERIPDLKREHELACQHAGTLSPVLLVYGGGIAVAETVKSLVGAIHFPEKTGPRHHPKKSWQKAQAAEAERTA